MFTLNKEPIKQKLLLLAVVFVSVLIVIISMESYLRHLTHKYDQAEKNQMAHRRLGRAIIRNLIETERDISRLSTATDIRDLPLYSKQVLHSLESIETILSVLQNGGNYIDIQPANINDKDEIYEMYSYQNLNQDSYTIAVLDLRPEIIDIRELAKLYIQASKEALSSGDPSWYHNNSKLQIRHKRISSQLLRARENATKIFYESHQEIERLYEQKNKAVFYISTAYRVFSFIAIVTGIITFGFVFYQIGGIIQHRREAERHTQMLKRQMDFILNATKTGIDIIDQHYNIRYIDPGSEAIYGDPTEKKCYEYFKDRKSPCLECGMQKALTTKEIVVAESTLSKEDDRPIQISIIPYQDTEGKWVIAEVKVDISERKRMEAKLGMSERKFRSFVENANDIIYAISQDGLFTYVSPNWTELLGHDTSDVLGQHYKQFVFDEDLNTFQMFVDQIFFHGEKIDNVVYRMRHQDDSLLWFTCNGSAIRDESNQIVEYVGISRDMTHQIKLDSELTRYRERLEDQVKERTFKLKAMNDSLNEVIKERINAEKQAHESQRILETILNSMSVGVVIIDKDKTIRQVNQAALQLTGYDDLGDLLGFKCHNRFCPSEEGRCPIFDLNHPTDKSEKILVTKSGAHLPILKSAVPIKIDSEELLLETFTDISQFKETRKKLLKTHEELIKASHQANHAEVVISTLNRVYAIIQEQDTPFNQKVQQIIGLTPNAFRFPSLTYIKITVGDQAYQSDNYASTPWHESTPIETGDMLIGTLEIGYLEKKNTQDESPFLHEEIRLIHGIAKQIGLILEHEQDMNALQRENHELRQMIEDLHCQIPELNQF